MENLDTDVMVEVVNYSLLQLCQGKEVVLCWWQSIEILYSLILRFGPWIFEYVY